MKGKTSFGVVGLVLVVFLSTIQGTEAVVKCNETGSDEGPKDCPVGQVCTKTGTSISCKTKEVCQKAEGGTCSECKNRYCVDDGEDTTGTGGSTSVTGDPPTLKCWKGKKCSGNGCDYTGVGVEPELCSSSNQICVKLLTEGRTPEWHDGWGGGGGGQYWWVAHYKCMTKDECEKASVGTTTCYPCDEDLCNNGAHAHRGSRLGFVMMAATFFFTILSGGM